MFINASVVVKRSTSPLTFAATQSVLALTLNVSISVLSALAIVCINVNDVPFVDLNIFPPPPGKTPPQLLCVVLTQI